MTDIDVSARFLERFLKRFSSSENSAPMRIARGESRGELMENVRNLIRLTYEYPFHSANPKKKGEKGKRRYSVHVKRPDLSCLPHTYRFV